MLAKQGIDRLVLLAFGEVEQAILPYKKYILPTALHIILHGIYQVQAMQLHTLKSMFYMLKHN